MLLTWQCGSVFDNAPYTSFYLPRVYKGKFPLTLINFKGNFNKSEIAKVTRTLFETVQTHANATHA